MFVFLNREEAGQKLAKQLEGYAGENTLVLALPRGGVPVGYEIARALHAPLDVFVVRKIGAPNQRELAIGAIAPGPTVVKNTALMRSLGVSEDRFQQLLMDEYAELERRLRLFRGARPFPELEGRTLILVDDGLATGSTALAAIQALRLRNPARLVLAVPVGSSETVKMLRPEVDALYCLEQPEPFFAVGAWYQDFAQTTDCEVIRLLRQAREEMQGSPI